MMSSLATSEKKLQVVAESLNSFAPRKCRLLPAESLDGYRCRCSFQIVRDSDGRIQYAVREDQQPVVISSFPMANERIQEDMKGLLEELRNEPNLCEHLSSVAFSTTWNHQLACLCTLNYEAPIEDESLWQKHAIEACRRMGFQQLTARSRKRVLRALNDASTTLVDTVWISKNETGWSVSLSPQRFATAEVHYAKPEGAFFHPNATAMRDSLEWMLNRLSTLPQPLSLLELYCGCGAHTMALAKSGLLKEVTAIELDERLVVACRENCRRNEVVVNIVSQDAGQWCAQNLHSANTLLVDPPRQGLDAQVCDMACRSRSIETMLYISCGKDALVRDLERLSGSFEVVDCLLLDLFPGTSAVESLVHLQRRPS